MKHKLYTRLLSLALAVGLVVGMLPGVTFAGAAEPNARSATAPEVSFNLPVQLFSDNGTNLNDLLEQEITIPISSGYSVNLGNIVEENGIGSLQNTAGTTYTYTNAAAAVNGTAITTLTAGEISSAQTGAVDGEIRNEGSDTQYKTVTRTVTHYVGVWYGNQPSQINASNVLAYKTYTETYQIEQKRERWWFFDWHWTSWEDVSGTRTQSDYSGASDQQSTDTVYFMYESSGEVETDRELSRKKYVTLNDDGTYDLTLTVSGAAGSINNPQKMDVLFIFDRSNSMKDYDRIGTVKQAAKDFVDAIHGNEAIDARYSIVTFSSYSNYDGGEQSDAQVHLGWTEWEQTGPNWYPSDNISDSIDEISLRGGTNYEAGIYYGISQLNNARPNAQKVVIFLTDGKPTYHIGGGDGQDDSGNLNINAAVNRINNMTADAFYAIGVGNSFNNPNSQEVKNLDSLCNAVNASQTGRYTAGDSESESALKEIFEEIASDSTSLLCTDVTITDTLTSYVEMVSQDGDGTVNGDDLYIEVLNGDDQTIKSGYGSVTLDEAKITARYDAEMKRIVLDFPDDYQLAAGYTYKVTAKIQATEAAYEAYRGNNGYIATGEEGTGHTSAGYKGMPTNEWANVTYTYNGVKNTSTYPVPVIQLDPKTLTIQKTVKVPDDTPDEVLNIIKSGTAFTVKLNDDPTGTSYSLSDFQQNGNVYTYSISGLSPNTAYEVSETAADLSPTYTLQTKDSGNLNGTLTAPTTTVSFTNAYTLAVGDLVIQKTVTGLDEEALAELKDEIVFTVTNANNETVATVKADTVNTEDDPDAWESCWTDGNFTYTVKDLPTGDYTVTETGHDAVDGYIWQGDGKDETENDAVKEATVTNNEAASVPFTNTYTPANINLTITKQIQGDPYGDGRDMFSFRITCIDCADDTNIGKVWYVHINGEGSKTITLPVGKYEVEELGNMHYEFVEVEPAPEILTPTTRAIEYYGYNLIEDETITFTNEPVTSNIPSDGGGVENHFDKYEDGKIVWKPEEYGDDGEIQPKPTPEPSGE